MRIWVVRSGAIGSAISVDVRRVVLVSTVAHSFVTGTG